MMTTTIPFVKSYQTDEVAIVANAQHQPINQLSVRHGYQTQPEENHAHVQHETPHQESGTYVAKATVP